LRCFFFYTDFKIYLLLRIDYRAATIKKIKIARSGTADGDGEKNKKYYSGSSETKLTSKEDWII
jgi:hypothetical protein